MCPAEREAAPARCPDGQGPEQKRLDEHRELEEAEGTALPKQHGGRRTMNEQQCGSGLTVSNQTDGVDHHGRKQDRAEGDLQGHPRFGNR